MRKLEEFVFEKLKVTKNSGEVSIKTTLRKFLAWFTGEEEFRINRFDIEDRNYISSDESMGKGDITFFLYKHMNDTIYIKEEEKRAGDESRSALYNYSFDIEGITFSIDARIYHDNELLSNSKDYIIEKLKVTKKSSDLLHIKLHDFVTWYMYDSVFWNATDLEHVRFAEDTVNKYFKGSYKLLYAFIRTHEEEVISVYEEENTDDGKYIYSFKVDEVQFNLEAFIENTSDLLSNQWRLLVEKLKVTNNPINGEIKSTMKDFFLWYCAEDNTTDDFWESMSMIEFDNDVIEKNFNNMNEFVDWFEKHMDDTVYFDEVQTDKETYKYTFDCDGIEFVIEAWVNTDSTSFSKSQYIIRNLHEKLKVTNKNYDDTLLVKLGDFITWYMDYHDNLDANTFKYAEFAKEVTNKYFNGSYDRLYEFTNKHSQDVLYVSEEKTKNPKIYMYSFDVDDIPFNLKTYIEDTYELLSNQSKILL